MEIRPKVGFPKQCDEVHYPGRKAAGWVGYFAGGWFAVLGALGIYDCFTSPPPGTAPAQGALFCARFFTAGTALITGTAMVSIRTAMATAAEGLYYRDWRNRVWHLPWDSLEQVTISETFWRVGGGWYDLQPSRLGVQKEAVFLSGRFVPGGRTTVRVTARSRMVPHESDVQGGPMVAAIIARAGLVPGEGKKHEATWVRDRKSGVGSP